MSANLGDGSENWPLARMYDAVKDGQGNYEQALKSGREIRVRSGEFAPLPGRPWEARWRHEGPKPFNELDTVRSG